MGWDRGHGYVQAGMGLDELLHQCRAQAEGPTAVMSMSNMLRPCGAAKLPKHHMLWVQKDK